MQDRVTFICDKEGVSLDTDAFELLAQVLLGCGRQQQPQHRTVSACVFVLAC